MNRRLGDIDVDEFLDRYWQREPCLLRGVLDGYDFPLDGDDLAGLACEPLAESRLIEGPDRDGDWTLRHGPFVESDFENLGDECWTLLVQDVEKHYPPLAGLLERFDFLPRWRFDDLMLSFAAPGGSVGPHVDQYDVFLVQVGGRRHWSIAQGFREERRKDVPIDMLEHFEAEEAWTLEPGDALYLPPNVAHHGVAVDACLTCSVGFRAPSAADIAMGLGEWLARRQDEGGRYGDPPLSARQVPGMIDDEALETFAALLQSGINDRPGFDEFIGAFLSRYRLAQEPVANPAGVDAEQLLHNLDTGGGVQLHPWARLTWIHQEAPPGARLFASGIGHPCSPALARWLCGGALDRVPTPLTTPDRACLLQLFRAGILLAQENA